MFRRISRWLLQRRARKLRSVYSYFDGTQIVHADPLEIWMALQEHPEYVAEKHTALAEQGDVEGMRVVCKTVADVFHAVPYDASTGVGLTRAEMQALLWDYYLYLGEQKKRHDRLPNSPQSTAATSNASSAPTTSDTSDSGAADTTSGSAPQTQPGEESPQPSEPS